MSKGIVIDGISLMGMLDILGDTKMTIYLLRDVFMWCSIINIGVLLSFMLQPHTIDLVKSPN